MTELFLEVVNRSISAGWLILVVLGLRLVLKKAPKWVTMLLWGIVAFRLLCPITLESSLSLVPSAQTIQPEIMMDWSPTIDTGLPVLNSAINPVISETFAPAPAASANPLQILIPVASLVWIMGISAILLYTLLSWWILSRRVETAVRLRYNIYQSESVTTPFVMGIWKPRIYLPYNMAQEDIIYVVSHEKAHIRRRDHWWKPLGFLLVSIHWFNPLVWVGYQLFCRDMELACDEQVIQTMNNRQRADYAQALLSCSRRTHMVTACPIAFGEVGVKTRIRSVMNYRKPAFWMVLAAVAVCTAVCVCFLTDPKEEPPILEQPVETQQTESTPETAASSSETIPDANSDLAYFLEAAMPDRSFREMRPGIQAEILKEYGEILENYTFLGRESSDGSFFYLVGHFNGRLEENPFLHLYQTIEDTEEGRVQLLYWEEDLEAVDAALAMGQIPTNCYLIRNSILQYSHKSGYVFLHPMEEGWDLTEVYHRYLSTNGRAYLLDALSRGIAIATPASPYLEVCLVSETWGEVYEKIPLTEEQAVQILAEDRKKLETGYGFAATLYPGPNSSLNLEDGAVWYTESSVPQTVLDLAVEKCGYQFATPWEIQSEIVEATLECSWLEEPIRYASDLPQLQRILTNAEFGYMGKCGYGAKLTIQMADGTSMVLFKGTDGCDSIAFGSFGGYFIGDAENQQFWKIFGLDPMDKEPLQE